MTMCEMCLRDARHKSLFTGSANGSPHMCVYTDICKRMSFLVWHVLPAFQFADIDRIEF